MFDGLITVAAYCKTGQPVSAQYVASTHTGVLYKNVFQGITGPIRGLRMRFSGGKDKTKKMDF